MEKTQLPMQEKQRQESRREGEIRRTLDDCRSSCTDNLDPTLKTSTVDLQGFGFVAANPVYGPYACPEGSPGMNQGASGVHLA